jgi:putative membrane protein
VSAAFTFAGYYGFRLTRANGDLRYERGLVQRYSGTVPLDKVQTVAVDENVLMRGLGYASLRVETAGYAPGSSRSGGAEEAVPLANRAFVYDLARDLEPFGDGSFEAPPRRARRRYAGRYVLALVGATALLFAVDRFVVSLGALRFAPLPFVLVAPVAAHFKWRNRGYRLDEDHFVTRTGFWRRTTRAVPYYRVQTVFERRTVFQRRWGLASVTADTASSASLLGRDATAFDVDDDEGRRLHDALRTRLRERLRRSRAA